MKNYWTGIMGVLYLLRAAHALTGKLLNGMIDDDELDVDNAAFDYALILEERLRETLEGVYYENHDERHIQSGHDNLPSLHQEVC